MMRYSILLACLIFFVLESVYSQNEFGAVGSSWNYSYENHSGNGGGWTKIVVTGDTIINAEVQKKLSIVKYRYFWPPHVESYDSTSLGVMRIKGDSIFINDFLVLDFGMTVNDSLIVETEETLLQLNVDSVHTINIGGYDYKKWYGRKSCSGPPGNENEEEFEIIESIGQTAMDYLLWDSEGCILGGGNHTFSCYKNGDFFYPLDVDCMPFIISSTEDHFSEYQDIYKVYPNPVSDELIVESQTNSIESIRVFTIHGVLVDDYSCNKPECVITMLPLSTGIYYVEISANNDRRITKIIKQ